MKQTLRADCIGRMGVALMAMIFVSQLAVAQEPVDKTDQIKAVSLEIDEAALSAMTAEELQAQAQITSEQLKSRAVELAAVRTEMYTALQEAMNSDPQIKALKAELAELRKKMNEVAAGTPEVSALATTVEEGETELMRLAKRRNLIRTLLRKMRTGESDAKK